MINKNDFYAYVKVQRSGVTNMFDVRTVEQLSGLERSQILEIMESYDKLSEQYPDVVK